MAEKESEYDLLNTTVVGMELKVSAQTVINWIAAGKLKGLQLPGGAWRVPRSELTRILEPLQKV